MDSYNKEIQKTMKDAMYDILDITCGYGGFYNPDKKEGSAEELAKIIDRVRATAREAIIKG